MYEYSCYIGANNDEYTFTWYESENGLYAVGAVNGEPDGIIWTTSKSNPADAMDRNNIERAIEGMRNGTEFEWKNDVGPKEVIWYGPY